MEDGLRALSRDSHLEEGDSGLNPCCYGRWSQRANQNYILVMANLSLNPCCYGRWSQSSSKVIYCTDNEGLNPCCYGRWSQSRQ